VEPSGCHKLKLDITFARAEYYCDGYDHLLRNGSKIHVTNMNICSATTKSTLSKTECQQKHMWAFAKQRLAKTHVPAATNVKKGIPMTTT
jgi:hypothetical protein